MRIYENLFIVKPDATEEEIDGLVDQMSKNVTAAGGTIDKVDKWGSAGWRTGSKSIAKAVTS